MTPPDEPNGPAALHESDPWELAALFAAMRRHVRVSGAIVLGCLALASLSLLLPKFYTADATLSYDPQMPLIRGGGDLALTDPQRDAEIDAQLAEAASLAVARDVTRTVDLAANPRLQREADALAAHSDRPLSRDEAMGMALLDHVKARRLGQTPAFTISYTASSAEQAARIANLFAASYLAASVRQKAALADASARQLATRLVELRAQVNAAQADLAAFRLANHLIDIPDSTALEQEVAALRSQLADARGQASLAGTRSAAASATTVVGGGPGGAVDTTAVSALTQQRAATAAELAALQSRDGPQHPDVIVAQEKLAALDGQLAQALQGNRNSATVEAHGTAARARALAGSLTQAEARLTGALGHDARLLDLQNSALALRQAYQDLLKVSADQTAQHALVQPDAQQIGFAVAPLRPKFPRLGINLPVGLALGLVAAMIVAFVREKWRHTLGSVRDIARWLDTDYFAPLPMLPARRRSPSWAIGSPPRSFNRAPRSRRVSAAWQRLPCSRRAMRPSGRVIAISSALPGEGRTTASLALGRVLAQAGMKVALVAVSR